ncbi:hypothetical protein TWF696_004374 [Orbilia brochopaga]|uniref:Uncharacterized protein n=1 Tax=Orbilia brochopaga TaxID=3140254 RepID=A0AAV9V6L9_9PEZI
MTDNHNNTDRPEHATINGPPIPPARINRDPTHGRIGPIVNVPIPTNLDGRPDYNRAPGLDLSRIHPLQSLDDARNRKPHHTSSSNNPSSSSTGTTTTDTMDSTTTSAEHDARETSSLLSTRLPPELVPDILDAASYFAHATLASRSTTASIADGDNVYLTATIPDFEAFDESTAGRGGVGGGRPGRVRKLVFTLRSGDQGWSSWRGDRGTYRGCWSWVDVELWRPTSASTTTTIPPNNTASTSATAAASAATTSTDYDADGDYVTANEFTDVTEGIDSEDDSDDNNGNDKKDQKNEDGKELIGTYLLQRNKHAAPPETRVIEWDYQTDELPDDDDAKWEDGTINEEGQRDRWHRDGRMANGAFVRELKGGDEVRVVMRARYPGWSCSVEKCEVECWWAV